MSDGYMKWKYKTIQELRGGSLSSNMVRVAIAVNHNAYTLKEAVQKIEELSERIDTLENRIDELLKGEEE